MKILKYFFGFLLLLAFFLLIDPSGIGIKENIRSVRDWATGKEKKLKFEQYWKDRK